jgi:transposase
MPQASERPRGKRLSWESRCEVVATIEAGMSPPLAAASGGCSRATAYRLWRRYREGGWAALQDRPSTPGHQPRRLPAEVEERIVATRRRTAFGPVRLASLVPYPPSTIGKVLRRHGCSRLPRPGAAARCARRYERERPGELLHIDTKQLGRFWEPASVSSAPRRAARSETAGSDGSTCTSRSTTTHDLPTPSSSPLAMPRAAPASWRGLSLGTPSRASRSSAC